VSKEGEEGGFRRVNLEERTLSRVSSSGPIREALVQLSYSKIKTYRQCPLRYRFTYLDRLPRRPRRLFRAGRRIHHALMRWLVYAKKGVPRWEEVEAAYNAAWDSAEDPAARGSRDYDEGLQILRGYHEANAQRPCRPVLLEHRFSARLGGHVLTGALDRVDASDSGYDVIDYKLHRDIPTQGEVDEDLQLGLYHVALEEQHGIRADTLSLYFLRHNLERTTTRSADQVRELKRLVVLTGDDIGTDRRWSPCKGDHCGGCDFRATCPAHTGVPIPAFVPRVMPVDTQLTLLQPEPALPMRPSPASSESDGGNQLSLPLTP
jgi:RecB family exonuclease